MQAKILFPNFKRQKNDLIALRKTKQQQHLVMPNG
jgi:hypothetical protein